MTTDIAAVIERLYDLRTWRAFDIDDDGRVLAGWDPEALNFHAGPTREAFLALGVSFPTA